MLQNSFGQFLAVLGFEKDSGGSGIGETALRTILVYAIALAIVRLGSKRFLSKASAFDVVVAIMLGSIMSRGVDGSSPLLPTIVAGAVLLGLHWLFGVLAFHTKWFGPLVKGQRVLLIKDGQIQEEGLREGSITRHDLNQAIRLETEETDPSKIKLAYLERDGNISVIPHKKKPRVVEVFIEQGVQIVRIEMD
jgi:uncharacterized membrane protein YcaP (DUF421 family)